MSNAGYRVRPRKGDVKAKQLRKEKIIPGILYGGAYSESVMIEMDQNELIKLMRENSYSSSIPLEGLDGKVNVIIKEIQSDSMTGLPQHFDFQAISKDEVMTFAIPVKIIGEEELKGKDIYIQIDHNEVNLRGTVDKMPHVIEADVSKLEVGDRILLSEIDLPKEVEVLDDPETIVCIAHSSAVQEEEPAEEVAEPAPAVKTEE